MSTPRGRNHAHSSHRRRASNTQNNTHPSPDQDDGLLGSRQLEAFGRTVHATATHLIGPLAGDAHHYQNALGDIHRELRRPLIQRSIFNLANASPKELVRSTLSVSEIQHRALVHLPDDLLRHVPESTSSYSLFQGFQASLPEDKKTHGRHNDKGQKLLAPGSDSEKDSSHQGLHKLKSKKTSVDHRLEMMAIRKNMCVSEIREIDTKIANLNTLRKIVLGRLGGLEQEEADLEHDSQDLSEKLQDLQEELEDAAALATKSPVMDPAAQDVSAAELAESTDTFMSESVYDKLPPPSPKADKKKRRVARRKSMPVLHEHLDKGSRIREFQAHNDIITALDFDAPFGTLVSAALDDTVRVWDLNSGRCIGLLEGHLSSVRCLQVQDNFVATGSIDASIRLWDLNQADYSPPPSARSNGFGRIESDDEEEAQDDADSVFDASASQPLPIPTSSSMADCLVFELSAHVAEVTAINFHKTTLVSGSADKTLRQWDLESGRCVQTLDVMWAAAQASVTSNTFGAASPDAGDGGGWWRPAAGRLPAAEADFVGALQVFETALACGTADGLVRLWDLRSGSVHRSLIGHTGPITSLAFSGVQMVTGSADRSIRIWDLRTGGIIDAFAYDSPIVDSSVDTRHIVSAIGESVVKIYDKADGNQWDCGPGVLEEENEATLSAIERVRIKDGYLVEGRKDGVVGVWSC